MCNKLCVYMSYRRFASKMHQLDLTDGCCPSSEKSSSNSESVKKEFDKEVKAYMLAPDGHIPATELLVKLNASPPNNGTETTRRDWSSPFLVPVSGSTNVTIPQSSTSGAFFVSVTSIPVSAELFGRTRAIAFRPRYFFVYQLFSVVTFQDPNDSDSTKNRISRKLLRKTDQFSRMMNCLTAKAKN
jgi:hypothetical protein